MNVLVYFCLFEVKSLLVVESYECDSAFYTVNTLTVCAAQ